MKYVYLLLVVVFFGTSCTGNKDVFTDKRVEYIYIKFNDSTFTETNLKYDENNRLISFSQIERKGSLQNDLIIDSIQYHTDSVTMFDSAQKRMFEYKLKDGIALNCYVTSRLEGGYTASFHYMNRYLIAVHETKAVSFTYLPDTIYRIGYDEKYNIVDFQNRFYKYSITPSDEKNSQSLLLYPVNYDIYTPAFYAGLLGYTSIGLISAFVQNGEETSYTYSYSDNGLDLTLIKPDTENISVKYRFKK
jgi:hypothetical protein